MMDEMHITKLHHLTHYAECEARAKSALKPSSLHGHRANFKIPCAHFNWPYLQMQNRREALKHQTLQNSFSGRACLIPSL